MESYQCTSGIGSGNGYRKDTLSQAGKPLYGCSGGERISAGFAIGAVGVYRPGQAAAFYDADGLLLGGGIIL